MTAKDTAIAHEIIEGELARIPEADRGEVASQVLGALNKRFMLLPRGEEAATRAQTEAVMPWLYPARGSA